MTLSIMADHCYDESSLMLNVTYAECHIQALYAECHFAECRSAECHYTECCGANIFWLNTVIYFLH
jgi:hypothetical protein